MEQNEATRNKEKAMQYAFLGGFAGIHNFYLGETGRGAFKLMIACMFGLMAIGSGGVAGGLFVPLLIWTNLVRGVRFLNTNQKKFDLRYNPQLFVKKGEEAPPPPVEVAGEIYKLNQLFEKGIINFEEFERRKQKLLD